MRRPWVAAILLGTVATPPAVILAVPAPRPLDAILAWPLVLLDGWAPKAPAVRVGALLLGILLTWVHYIIIGRLLVWRAAAREAEDA